MAISVDNCKISPYLRIKNTLAEGFPWNWVTMEGLKKLEWWGYLAEKKYDDNFSLLHNIYERIRRTDRRISLK